MALGCGERGQPWLQPLLPGTAQEFRPQLETWVHFLSWLLCAMGTVAAPASQRRSGINTVEGGEVLARCRDGGRTNTPGIVPLSSIKHNMAVKRRPDLCELLPQRVSRLMLRAELAEH